jgi:hypothetical protein
MDSLFLHELDELYTEFEVNGNNMPKIELFVICKGQQTLNGGFIETIVRKPKMVSDGFAGDFYVTYKGRPHKIVQVVRGVCCGYNLAIEFEG